MGTAAYYAGEDTNSTEMSFAPEVNWGETPTGSGAFQKFRVNSESFSESKNRARPGELRSDLQAAAATTQDVSASGGVQFGISYGNTDTLIAGLLTGAWTSDLNISAAAISAVNATAKFVGMAGDFDDAVVGQFVKVAGFATSGSNGYFRVTAVATDGSDITVHPAPTDDAGGTDTVITITGSMLRNAQTINTFSVQKRWSSKGFVYPGVLWTSGQINAQRGSFFSGTLDALCKAEVKAAVEVGSNAVAAPTNKVMNTVGHFKGLNIDGTAAAAKIKNVNLTLTREGAANAFALGDSAAVGLSSVGTLNVSGTMEAYFSDYDLYDAYKAETEKRIDYRVTDTAGNTYIVSVPVAVLSKSTITAGGPNGDVMASFEFMADPSTDLGCTVQIDRFAA